MVICWLAISTLLLTGSLSFLFIRWPSAQLLREDFDRDQSGTLHVSRGCGLWGNSGWGGGGPGGSIYVSSRTRRSFVAVWEETTVRWSPSPPPAREIDAAMAGQGSSLEDRRLASLPAGTTTTLRPSLGLLFVPLFALLLIEPAFEAQRRLRIRRARLRAERGCCGACGYDRRGSAARAACPECGSLRLATCSFPTARTGRRLSPRVIDVRRRNLRILRCRRGLNTNAGSNR
jgi:hypothetical protein